jgi:mono/diheme cytochrome c family protein
MRTKHIFGAWCVGIAAVLLAACSAGSTNDPVARGQQIFHGEVALGDDIPTCISCHSVQAGEVGVIGTNLSNIGNRAAVTVPGQAPDDYLRTSIVNGDAFLAGGYQEGIHYRGYGDVLSRQHIDDLVAYMLTLRSGQD